MKTSALCLVLLSIAGCASNPYSRPGATPEQVAADQRQCQTAVDATQLIVPGKNPVATKVKESTARGAALDACMRDKGYH